MAQSLIACPLCSAASFSSTNTLCLSLVSVASKWLRCTLCEEELHGLDKFTIHLVGHLVLTDNFKKHLVTDHPDSPDMKQISHTEPLNLVKTHTGLLKETMNEITPSNIVLNESLSFQSKQSSDANCERPSLKIDDEVMIFFNYEDQSVQNSSSDKITCPEKICEMSCSPALCNLAVDFDQSVEKNSNNISTTKDITTTILNDEYFNLPFTNNEPHYLFPTNLNPGSYSECSNKIVGNETEMDLSLSDKQKESENNVEATENSDNLINKSNEYCALQKVTGNRSSFLSPRGERVLGYRCDVCSLVFPDEQILLMHRNLIHTELSGDPTKEKKYKCHLCSKSFIMKGSLMVHMRVAHFGGAVVARLVEAKQLESNAVSPDSAQYVCSICNKGFTKEQQLTQHEKLHEGKQCDICLKTFTTKYFLRKHKRLHTGEMPYSCNVCNKSFTFQQSYHKHLLYHSDDKPYSCGDCGRAFKELSTLHNHQRIHTGEKPFSCETCGKCFRQRVSYLVHRRIHTGVMPYKCQDCGKTFRYKVSERTHKCTISAQGSSIESPKTAVSNTMQQSETSNFNKEKDAENTIEEHQHQEEGLEEHQAMSGEDHVMSDTYPEPTDFFSFVMSPSDRLQHLSLSGDVTEDTNHNSIDSEALKQLLYDVADYS